MLSSGAFVADCEVLFLKRENYTKNLQATHFTTGYKLWGYSWCLMNRASISAQSPLPTTRIRPYSSPTYPIIRAFL